MTQPTTQSTLHADFSRYVNEQMHRAFIAGARSACDTIRFGVETTRDLVTAECAPMALDDQHYAIALESALAAFEGVETVITQFKTSLDA